MVFALHEFLLRASCCYSCAAGNNEEADNDEYMIATVLLSQEIKLARQRRRMKKLESALLQLKESTVLAYERMLAEDT